MHPDTLGTLEYRLADLEDPALFETLASWYQDPEIRAALSPNQSGQEQPAPTGEQLRAGYRRQNKFVWFIFRQGRLIGEVTLDPCFHHLMRPVPKTAWISIVIGERDCWRLGAGTAAMRFLEDTSRSMGFERIELGVFAFNQRALGLYTRMGYTVCGTHPHFTYWNGAWHDDIRLEKQLEPGG